MAFSPQPASPKASNEKQTTHLPTPEEPMLDSFERKTVLQPINAAPSPPESPAFNSFNSTSSGEYNQHDQILYPDVNGTATASADRPLFDSHLSYHWSSPRCHSSPVIASAASSPRSHVDSPLSLHDRPVSRHHPSIDRVEPIGPVALYNQSPADWYSLMITQMEGHKKQIQKHQANRVLPPPGALPSHSGNLDAFSQRQISMLGRRTGNRVEKSRPVTKAAPKAKAAAKTPVKTAELDLSNYSIVPPKIDPPPKRSRRQAVSPEAQAAVGPWSQSAAPKPRTRAAPSKKVDDKDYSEWATLPDYSPPTSSLVAGGKRLTATWNNSNSLNLDLDPDRDHLHPQEYEIASTLRLKCNQYLASKRRIFAAKVKAMKEGREFNKTSAQNCCTIDVNKASRLWVAFDGVGWFDDHWFSQYQ